jgi:hypothetical protein
MTPSGVLKLKVWVVCITPLGDKQWQIAEDVFPHEAWQAMLEFIQPEELCFHSAGRTLYTPVLAVDFIVREDEWLYDDDDDLYAPPP